VVGIVLVSHTLDLAESLARYLVLLGKPEVPVVPVGGDGGYGGATGSAVLAGIVKANRGDGVVVLGDLGGSVLTARHVIEQEPTCPYAVIADAPFVEGAVAAAMVGGSGASLKSVLTAAEGTRHATKLPQSIDTAPRQP